LIGRDEALTGSVRARSIALDPVTGLGLVRIAVDPGGPLALGLFGTATLQMPPRIGRLVIPATAMRGADLDGPEVVVCKDGRANVRSVKVGWRSDEQIEVDEGVEDGDFIATDHVLALESGSAIVEVR
jgi:HlyD family secretion protein